MTGTIQVRVIPKAKKIEVKKTGNTLKVYITSPPAEGKANKQLLSVLAGHFMVKKTRLSIIKGKKSRDKFIRILPITQNP